MIPKGSRRVFQLRCGSVIFPRVERYSCYQAPCHAAPMSPPLKAGYSFPNELGPIISADIEINRTSLREIPHTVPCHGEAMSWQGRIRVKEPKVWRLRYPTEEHRPVVVLAGSEHL